MRIRETTAGLGVGERFLVSAPVNNTFHSLPAEEFLLVFRSYFDTALMLAESKGKVSHA
jgi:hypothetical protein